MQLRRGTARLMAYNGGRARRVTIGDPTPLAAVYVAASGSVFGTGLSDSPVTTLTAGLALLATGGTLFLHRGDTWTEELDITLAGVTVAPYGSGADPIIDRANGGGVGVRGDWGISVRADDVTVEDIEVRNVHQFGIRLRSCVRATLRRCTVHGIDQNGIYAYRPDGAAGGGHLIEDCEVYDTGENGAYGEGNGMQFANTNTLGSTVTGCYVHDIGAVAGDHGIYYEGAAGGIITGNRFKATEGAGVKTRVGATITGNRMILCKVAAAYSDTANDVEIAYNSAYKCGQYPSGLSPYVAFWMTTVGTGCQIHHNIATGSGIGIQVTGSNTPTIDHNDITATVRYGHWKGTDTATLAAWRTASGQSANDLNVDPLYTDPDNDDLTLTVGSPAAGLGYEAAA